MSSAKGAALLLAGYGMLAMAAGSAPATPDPSVTAAIDQYCKTLEPADDELPSRVFGMYQPDPEKDGPWREYPDQDSIQKGVDEGWLFDIIRVWVRADGGVHVFEQYDSPSRDWIHYTDYCFRPDGSLAKSVTDFRSFSVAMPEDFDGLAGKRVTIRRFAQGGALIEERSQRYKMTLDRSDASAPVVDTPDDSVQFMDGDDPIYKAVDELPFQSTPGLEVGPRGTVCISSVPEGETGPEPIRPPYKRERDSQYALVIDDREPIMAEPKRAHLVEGLRLSTPHRVKILRDGKQTASFRFEYRKFKSHDLCLSYGQFYDVWHLIEGRSKTFGCTCLPAKKP